MSLTTSPSNGACGQDITFIFIDPSLAVGTDIRVTATVDMIPFDIVLDTAPINLVGIAIMTANIGGSPGPSTFEATIQASIMQGGVRVNVGDPVVVTINCPGVSATPVTVGANTTTISLNNPNVPYTEGDTAEVLIEIDGVDQDLCDSAIIGENVVKASGINIQELDLSSCPGVGDILAGLPVGDYPITVTPVGEDSLSGLLQVIPLPNIFVPSLIRVCNQPFGVIITDLPAGTVGATLTIDGQEVFTSLAPLPGNPTDPSPTLSAGDVVAGFYPTTSGNITLEGYLSILINGVPSTLPLPAVNISITGDCSPLAITLSESQICQGNDLSVSINNLPNGATGSVEFRMGDLILGIADVIPSMVIGGLATATLPVRGDILDTPGNYVISASLSEVLVSGLRLLPLFLIPEESNLTVLSASSIACSGGDPHIVCLDGSRLDVYDAGYYRLFDNLGEKEESPVIINAEIVRHFARREDAYSKIWIKLEDTEYFLSYEGQGVGVKSRTAIRQANGSTSFKSIDHGMSQSWKQGYKTSTGEEYIFYCEKVQNTVALEMVNPSRSLKKYNGLLAGKITKVSGLYDSKKLGVNTEVELSKYSANALLCGSAQPHIVSLQKKSLPVKGGNYRLLQMGDVILNVSLREDGILQGASLYEKGELVNTWKWEGIHHWSLTCFQDDKEMQGVFEKGVAGDNMLLRVQSNASISISLKHLTKDIRGLLVGDTSPVEDLLDTRVLGFSGVIDYKAVIGNGSLYERLIEPMS